MRTKNMEDFLETIFHLESEGRSAATQEIAQHLNISAASVTEYVKKLAGEKLVSYVPYKEVRLTAKGRTLAVDVVRRHRLSERLLVDKLGVKWEEAHEEAHKIEHDLSEEVSNKIYKALGEPKTCPHGNPLPDAKGQIKEEESFPLTTFKKNDQIKIIKITDEEPKLLCYLATLGLMPRTKITIEERAPFSGPIIVRVGRATYALGYEIAEAIWVRKI